MQEPEARYFDRYTDMGNGVKRVRFKDTFGHDLTAIALIPARGGSKGIRRKNIRLLGGKPLIAWTIEASLGSLGIERTIVSTEDSEIAQVARKQMAEVPFMRPGELALDDTPDYPVFEHALTWLENNEGYTPDIVAWLRPTSPLRSSEDIMTAVSIIVKTGVDCVRSVCPVEHHPYWMKSIVDGYLKPFIKNADENMYYCRQLLPHLYRLNGAVDVFRTASVLKKRQLYPENIKGYIMPVERSIDLDTELDFTIAEILLGGEAL